MNSEVKQISKIIEDAKTVVIIQADNPDGDSLASSLALEQILGELGKTVYLYCAVDMPSYLKHLSGWDRVTTELPSSFDASIIVDTSTVTLLEKLIKSEQRGWVASKPCIVLDHHAEANAEVDFATVTINDTASSATGEVIYDLATSLKWPLDTTSGEYIMSAILSDTQGLTNELASAKTYNIMASLIQLGVNRPKLEEARKAMSKMDPRIFLYKATLIQRTEFHTDGILAIVEVPYQEIMEYSPLYNPGPLIQNDMLQTEGVGISIVLKHYNRDRTTGSIRCNNGFEYAAKIAETFGGGGHAYAAGFKVLDGRPLDEIKSECVRIVRELTTGHREQ